jgi:uncharacterized protein (TIGR02597 family)
MPRFTISLLALAVCALALPVTRAQSLANDVRTIEISKGRAITIRPPVVVDSVPTDPVGFHATSALSNSDTMLSIPFTRPPEATASIQAASGYLITVSGTPGWSANQFVYVAGIQPKTYYALIGASSDSPKEGHIYRITGNDSNTLIVDTTADNLKGITAATPITIIPYWTPATLFPAAAANVSFTPTGSTAIYKTQIVVPNNASPGTVTTYFFSNNVDGTASNLGWRAVGNKTTDRGDDPLVPNSHFTVRNLNSAPTLPLKSLGRVLTTSVVTPLQTSVSGPRDNAVSMVRPVPVTLNQTGLNPIDGSFVATPISERLTRYPVKDQLLVFDKSQAGFDKQPSAIYYYAANPAGWRMAGDGQVDHGEDVIPAGSGLVIRKAATADGATVFWTNAPAY